MIITFISLPLNTCYVRWRPVPGLSYFFSMETPVKEDMGAKHQTSLCQCPWDSKVEGHGIKDIYPYFIMFSLCLVTCEYVQHIFLNIRGYSLIRPLCRNIKCSLLLFIKKKIILNYFMITSSFYSTMFWWTHYQFINLFCHIF